MESKGDARNRWAIILAGGDGTRLSDITRRIAGEGTPKQFCNVIGDRSLIEQTRNRVALTIDVARIFYALARKHGRYFRPLLRGVLSERLVVQRENRGTAAAILYSLLRLSMVAPDGQVALFPCDHYVSDDPIFMRHVEMAFSALDTDRDLIVLLGITPDAPESDYGWIKPSRQLGTGASPVLGIRRFVEKPPIEVARRLWSGGEYLWNSFVLIARVSTLLELIGRKLPAMFRAFEACRSVLGSNCEDDAFERLYASLEPKDFSHDVLTNQVPCNLGVLPVVGLNWSDLGNPSRLLATLGRLKLRPEWAA